MITQTLHAAIIACNMPASLAACWSLRRAGPLSPPVIYMMNLLLWDVMFVLISTPNTFGSQSWASEHLACRLYRMASEATARLSTNSLLALAVAEYVWQPRDARLVAAATKRSCLVVMALWLLTVLQSLATVPRSALTKTECLQLQEADPYTQRVATIIDFVCSFALPIALMAIFIILLITKPSKRERVPTDVGFVTELNEVPSFQPVYTKLVIALIIIFIIFNIPFYGHMVIVFFSQVVKNLEQEIGENVIGLLIPLGFWSRYVISVLNPILIVCVVCISKNCISKCKSAFCNIFCHNRERAKRISNIPILS